MAKPRWWGVTGKNSKDYANAKIKVSRRDYDYLQTKNASEGEDLPSSRFYPGFAKGVTPFAEGRGEEPRKSDRHIHVKPPVRDEETSKNRFSEHPAYFCVRGVKEKRF